MLKKNKILFLSIFIILLAIILQEASIVENNSLNVFTQSVYEFFSLSWKGILIGFVAIIFIDMLPQNVILKIMGDRAGFLGILKAVIAGFLLDLCNHGILMMASRFYDKGVRISQIFAFLIATPWNSFSLMILLYYLVGLKITVVFTLLSLLIALITGYIVDILLEKKYIIENPNKVVIDRTTTLKQDFINDYKNTKFNSKFIFKAIVSSIFSTKKVIKWVLFGIVLASSIRAFIPVEVLKKFFGANSLGIFSTLAFATVLEVCSEGALPIAADFVNKIKAIGNSFVFLMAGVATDYTEIAILKDTTKSFKIAFLLPIITVPQILLWGYVLNRFM